MALPCGTTPATPRGSEIRTTSSWTLSYIPPIGGPGHARTVPRFDDSERRPQCRSRHGCDGNPVEEGDQLAFSAFGQIWVGVGVSGGESGPDGKGLEAAGIGWPVPDLAPISLVGMIGSTGPFFMVGTSSTFTVDDAEGQVFLGVNDMNLGDNWGPGYTCIVTRFRPRIARSDSCSYESPDTSPSPTSRRNTVVSLAESRATNTAGARWFDSVRSEIEGDHGSGTSFIAEPSSCRPDTEAAVFAGDDDILDVVAQTGQMSMRHHHREADDPGIMANDVDLGLRCDECRESRSGHRVPSGPELRRQPVEVGNDRSVDQREPLEVRIRRATHVFDRSSTALTGARSPISRYQSDENVPRNKQNGWPAGSSRTRT